MYDWKSNWERRKAIIVTGFALAVINIGLYIYGAATSGDWLSWMPMALTMLGGFALILLLEFFGGSFMEGPWP